MNQSKISTFTKIFSMAIILLPFLYQYASPLSFLSMGDFVITILTCFGLFKININSAAKRISPIIFFSFAFIILTIFVSFFSISYFKFADAVTIFLKIILYLCVCLVCTEHFDLQYIKKFYFALVFIFAVYLVIQVIYNKVSGKFLPIYLKHEWLFSWEKRPKNLYDYYVTGVYFRFRPSSLFLEPGYYALFVLPALFLLLFERKKIIAAFLLYLTIVFSTSGAGIIIGFFAFVLKGLSYAVYFKNGKLYFTHYIIVAIILLVVGFLCLILSSGDKISKLFNSFNSRIARSLLIFNKVDFFHKIFGVGMNNTENFVNAYSIYTLYDEGNLNFGASLVASLVQYGVVGFLFFLFSLIALIMKNRYSKIGFIMITLYAIYTVFEEVIFNYRMAFLLSFVIYYIRIFHQRNCVKSNMEIKTNNFLKVRSRYGYRN